MYLFVWIAYLQYVSQNIATADKDAWEHSRQVISHFCDHVRPLPSPIRDPIAAVTCNMVAA